MLVGAIGSFAGSMTHTSNIQESRVSFQIGIYREWQGKELVTSDFLLLLPNDYDTRLLLMWFHAKVENV
jgi:hypothetical protein